MSDAKSVGVEVDADDLDFARAHEGACAGCGAESAVWRSMAAAETGAPDESGQRLAHLVLEALDEPTTLDRVLEEAKQSRDPWHARARRSRWPLRSVAASVAVLAASMAAGVFVELHLRAPVSPFIASPSAPEPTASATSPTTSKPVAEGSEDADSKGEGAYRCETPAPDVTVCATGGARYETQGLAGSRRVLELREGRVVVALGTQRKGSAFVVATPFGRVSATGTVFSVETDGEAGAWARVERGKVRVTRAGAKDTHWLRAGQQLRLDDASRPMALPDGERARDLQALTIEVADSESAPSPHRLSTQGARGASTGGRDDKPVADEDVSAMLARARGLLGRGDFAAAAQAYQRAYEAAPSTAEGGAALVSLGDLRLSELGDPRGALDTFDAYLARGEGVLAPEAQFGRIGALRALGRRGEERDAARAFLRDHPGGPQADAVRRRLEN